METKGIKKILVPTDFSEAGEMALEHAGKLAKLCNAEICLLHVIELYPYMYNAYEPTVMVMDTDVMEEKETKELITLARKVRAAHGVVVYQSIRRGKIKSEIIEAVKEEDIDLIVMSTHGAQGFREFFLGSNSQKVVQGSPCPVITIPPGVTKLDFKRIVMPIDNTLHSRQKVDHVIALAKMYGSTVNVLGLIDDEVDPKRFAIKMESVEKALSHAGIDYLVEKRNSENFGLETMEYAEDKDADLIAIMTDHESHTGSMLMGALAKQIVNHSSIPVLSIRPIRGIFDDMGAGGSPFA